MAMAFGGPDQNARPPLGLRAGAMPAVHIVRLQLTAFRAWPGADIKTDHRPVVLTGPNGSGKTNILEAISMLTPGRGLLGARIGDLARVPSNAAGGWAVAADVKRGDHVVRLGAGAQKDSLGRERRVFRLEGEPAASGDIGEVLRLLWLTPAMDRLFVESAGTRRRFFDRLILSLHPAHGPRVARYEQAMAERSRLLKEGKADPAWLSGLERGMAEDGVAIAATRAETCAALGAAITGSGALYDEGLFPRAGLALECAVAGRLRDGPAIKAEDWLAGELAQGRARDAAAGRALSGPHRADWAVTHLASGRSAALCSGGEQKALLLTLVLAHLRLVAETWGRVPLLLIDEVCAQLDEARREALFEALQALGCQVWMTGTDEAQFASLRGKANFIDTSHGAALAPAHLI